MSPLAVVVIAGVGTYLLRVSLIALLGRVSIPPLGERALRLVAPTVLATIAAQGVLTLDGQLRPFDVRHVAAAVAFAVAWWTKSIAWTLAVGMGSLWMLAWLVPGW
ncbi:MAG: AzlD domain-containing protein [Acidimicrobiia bacterium]